MIQIYNRQTNKYDTEDVAGGKYIKWAYESPIGKSFVELFMVIIAIVNLVQKKLTHLLKTLTLILIYLLMIHQILKVLMIFLLENLLLKLGLLIKIKIP